MRRILKAMIAPNKHTQEDAGVLARRLARAARQGRGRSTPPAWEDDARRRRTTLLGELPKVGLTQEQLGRVRAVVEGAGVGIVQAASELAIAMVGLRERLTQCGYAVEVTPTFRVVAVDGLELSPARSRVRDVILAEAVPERDAPAQGADSEAVVYTLPEEAMRTLVEEARRTMPFHKREQEPLTSTQGIAIKRLAHTGNCSLRDIARVLGVTPMTVMYRLRDVGLRVSRTISHRVCRLPGR